MIIYKEITNYTELYAFHMNIKAPYISEVEYGDYLKSLFNDTDSYGHKLFKELHLIGAYSNEELIGFIQFGVTNIGFDDIIGYDEDTGEVFTKSTEISANDTKLVGVGPIAF